MKPESQPITAVEMLPRIAPDREEALDLAEESEQNTGMKAEEAIAHCGYVDGVLQQV